MPLGHGCCGMKTCAWQSPYPTEVTEVCLRAVPSEATLTLLAGDQRTEFTLTLKDPRPLTSMCEALEECWQVHVIDTNSEQGGCLKFGRYRVEFWDEDGLFAALECDDYELRARGARGPD